MEAAEFLREENFLPDAPLRMWLNGAWVDTELLAFEVYYEPIPDYWKDPRSEELAAEANEALYAGDSERAERLLNRCLEMEGERPTLLNNLAAAYQRQNQTDKARALVEKISRKWPDYFFGKAARAQQAIRDGDIETARDILTQLSRTRRLHRSEFTALAAAQLTLLLKTGELEGAATWLQLWRRLTPDDANIAHFERRLSLQKVTGALSKGASALRLNRPLQALRSAVARKKKSP
jgi:tetratricopeptide (TPR) repeat protein